MMTNWLPDMSQGSGPLYVRLAERIEEAIASGTLPTGTKLPPQRDLAFDIGVTIGTVGRAYPVVRERGLVSGEVGRGTFVLGGEADQQIAPASIGIGGSAGTRAMVRPGKLRMDSTSAPAVGQSEAIARLTHDILRKYPDEVVDYTRVWPSAWQEAGSRWLRSGDWMPDPASVVSTNGAHAAGSMSGLKCFSIPRGFRPQSRASVRRILAGAGRRICFIRSSVPRFGGSRRRSGRSSNRVSGRSR